MLDIDTEKERISLGVKQLSENPAESAMTGLKKGGTVTCTVSKVQDNGMAVTQHYENLFASLGFPSNARSARFLDALKKKQAELVANHIKNQDIVITTALIPGRKAPVLVTEAMVQTMKPGSIIVDLAAEQGGNCPLTKAGEVIEVHGVIIMGHTDLPSRLAVDTSSLYARNLFNFVQLIVKDGALALDWDDEIVKGAGLTKDGEIVHPVLKG